MSVQARTCMQLIQRTTVAESIRGLFLQRQVSGLWQAHQPTPVRGKKVRWRAILLPQMPRFRKHQPFPSRQRIHVLLQCIWLLDEFPGISSGFGLGSCVSLRSHTEWSVLSRCLSGPFMRSPHLNLEFLRASSRWQLAG